MPKVFRWHTTVLIALMTVCLVSALATWYFVIRQGPATLQTIAIAAFGSIVLCTLSVIAARALRDVRARPKIGSAR